MAKMLKEAQDIELMIGYPHAMALVGTTVLWHGSPA
jgi:hypothetical protein